MSDPNVWKNKIWDLCQSVVERNVRTCQSGSFWVSGGHQFETIWTRDFCMSVPGLLHLGRKQEVEHQLRTIFNFQASDGWLPRGLDVVDPKLRVVSHMFGIGGSVPFKWGQWQKHRSLRAEYRSEHGAPAYDGNLLFLRAVSQLEAATGLRLKWLSEDNEVRLIQPYLNSLRGGLLEQPAYSDWQDSLKRRGPIAFTHLLWLDVLERRPHLEKIVGERALWESKIGSTFWDDSVGLLQESVRLPGHFAFDTHAVFFLNSNLLPQIDRRQLWSQLCRHQLWTQLGLSFAPQPPDDELSWTAQLAGLKHYHCGYKWGWLAAEGLMVALELKSFDQAQLILQKWTTAFCRDQEIFEIYDQNLKPVRTWMYRSESPFLWTAAKWIEALCSLEKSQSLRTNSATLEHQGDLQSGILRPLNERTLL